MLDLFENDDSVAVSGELKLGSEAGSSLEAMEPTDFDGDLRFLRDSILPY